MKNVNNLASYYMNLNPNFCLSSSINCVNNEPEITLMETDYFILNSNDIQIESNQLNTSFPFITYINKNQSIIFQYSPNRAFLNSDIFFTDLKTFSLPTFLMLSISNQDNFTYTIQDISNSISTTKKINYIDYGYTINNITIYSYQQIHFPDYYYTIRNFYNNNVFFFLILILSILLIFAINV